MNITDSEFQREVEALKCHRRLSVNRPILDPDLPDLAAVRGGGQELLSAPGSEHEWRGVNLVDEGVVPSRSPSSSSILSDAPSHASDKTNFTAKRRGRGTQRSSSDGSATPGSHRSESPSSAGASRRSASRNSQSDSSRTQDPSHLFWVPASVHPEISPTDFRNFLKDHAARAVTPLGTDGNDTLGADEVMPLPSETSPFAKRISSLRLPAEGTSDLISRSTSLTRRGSTLRRQYRPEQDTDDDESSTKDESHDRVRVGQGRGGFGINVPTLTIDDLQKLEQLAEEASRSQDPTRLRSVLRRTLSLNVNPSALDQVDDAHPETDDADAPIIVPMPGQILRRAARTKIRKSSSSSDGGRAGLAQRRRATQSPYESDATSDSVASAEFMERRQSNQSELSSGADDESSLASSSRPVSDEAGDSIVDAYSRESYHSDASQRTSVTSFAETTGSERSSLVSESRLSKSPSPPVTPTQASVTPKPLQAGYFDIDGQKALQSESSQASGTTDGSEVLRDGQLIHESPATSPVNERTPSNQIKPIPVSHIPPVPSFEKTTTKPQLSHIKTTTSTPPSTASLQQKAKTSAQQGASFRPDAKAAASGTAPSASPAKARPVSPPPQKTKDKERKGGFGLSWFGLGKDDDEEREKPSKAEREKERKREKYERREKKEREREDDRDKDSSSFLGSLFGKKKGHEDPGHVHPAPKSVNGQITAGSLLDRSAAGGLGKLGYHYYRYPIHIERAVYRLSHIKLANPRRPLYEQVLISNLMFWYLSIINQSQQQQQMQKLQQQQQQQQQQQEPEAQQQSQAVPPLQQQQSSPSFGASTGNSNAVAAAQAAAGVPIVPSSSITADGEAAASVDGAAETADWGNAPQGNSSPPSRSRRGALVKPDRAPTGGGRGRSAETPMKQPGYGIQHRQIDDDMKTMTGPNGYGSQGIAEQIASAGGFRVGQVVDTKTLQTGASYHTPADTHSQALESGQGSGLSTTTNDYLGLGEAFLPSSQSLWPTTMDESESHTSSSDASPASSIDARSPGRERERGKEYDSGAWIGSGRKAESPHAQRSEAQKERAWLGGVPRSPSGGSVAIQRRSDPVEASDRDYDESGRSGKSDRGNDPHHRSRSHSYALSSSPAPMDRASGQERMRKTSRGSDHRSGHWNGGANKPDDQLAIYSGSDGIQHSNGHITLPSLAGSSAMLEAARTSQSRRR